MSNKDTMSQAGSVRTKNKDEMADLKLKKDNSPKNSAAIKKKETKKAEEIEEITNIEISIINMGEIQGFVHFKDTLERFIDTHSKLGDDED